MFIRYFRRTDPNCIEISTVVADVTLFGVNVFVTRTGIGAERAAPPEENADGEESDTDA